MKSINGVNYRLATLNDSITDIAKLIYWTDPYIYPCAFRSYDEKEWLKLIELCFHDLNNFYYFENIYVAEKDGKILSIIVAVKNGKAYRFLPDLYNNNTKSIQKVIDGYYIPLSNEILELTGTTIVNFCTDIDNRGKGIGKKLFDYYLSQNNVNPTYLDVISENSVALSVYKSLGFQCIREYLGFSGESSSPVRCFSMVKK